MFCPTCLNALRQNQLNKATFCHFTLVSYAIFYKCKIQWIFETAIFLASVVEAFSKSDQENKFSFGGLKCFASVEDIIETYKVIVFAFADSEKAQNSTSEGRGSSNFDVNPDNSEQVWKDFTNSTSLSVFSSKDDAFPTPKLKSLRSLCEVLISNESQIVISVSSLCKICNSVHIYFLFFVPLKIAIFHRFLFVFTTIAKLVNLRNWPRSLGQFWASFKYA